MFCVQTQLADVQAQLNNSAKAFEVGLHARMLACSHMRLCALDIVCNLCS